MLLSILKLSKADWHLVYQYDYNDHGAGFKTFAAKDIPGITITHDRKIGAKTTLIYYTVDKKRTDSPSQAVKWYNQHETQKAVERHEAQKQKRS